LINVDTRRLHLFLLSVIWRCSITKNEHFKHITLGVYEEKIRSILKSLQKDITSKVNLIDFSIIISKFEFKSFPELIQGAFQIPGPVRLKDYGINSQLLYLPNGFKVLIKTDKGMFPHFIQKLILKGSEIIVPVRPFEGSLEAKTLAAMLESRQKIEAC
jgi:hypothetical protein